MDKRQNWFLRSPHRPRSSTDPRGSTCLFTPRWPFHTGLNKKVTEKARFQRKEHGSAPSATRCTTRSRGGKYVLRVRHFAEKDTPSHGLPSSNATASWNCTKRRTTKSFGRRYCPHVTILCLAIKVCSCWWLPTTMSLWEKKPAFTQLDHFDCRTWSAKDSSFERIDDWRTTTNQTSATFLFLVFRQKVSSKQNTTQPSRRKKQDIK